MSTLRPLPAHLPARAGDQPAVVDSLLRSGVLTAGQAVVITRVWPNLEADDFHSPFTRTIAEHTVLDVDAPGGQLAFKTITAPGGVHVAKAGSALIPLLAPEPAPADGTCGGHLNQPMAGLILTECPDPGPEVNQCHSS